MICFLGTSHAPQTLAAAAIARGLRVTQEAYLADLIFVSEDTPTNEKGERNTAKVTDLMLEALKVSQAPIVLTSQVPPGFTRSFDSPRVFHIAETLRMKDAMQRAMHPEQFIVGVADPHEYVLPKEFMHYLYAHHAERIHIMSYEEAEMAKISINMMLAAQVECTNRLAAACEKVGAKWERVREALRSDSRIGESAYLTPGRWQDSRHLLRDHITLEAILAR